jgi:NAD(P)-dependent dehydrogenase (short-subunit alcohol dehydrogenase family)
MDLARWGFDDDTVVITGGGSGIGRATAIACAALGLRVSLWDIAADTAQATIDALGVDDSRAHLAIADVSDPAAVEAAFADTIARLGPVRYLVNNAGPRAADPYSFDEGMRLGAGSVELVTRLWLATSPPPAASIVNVASVAGNIVGTDPAWYGANKAAIAGYTRSMALALAPQVRVNAVAPSLVNTARTSKWTDSDLGRHWAETNPLQRWAVADDIAYPIVYLLSPLAGYINGVLLPVDGGQTLVL